MELIVLITDSSERKQPVAYIIWNIFEILILFEYPIYLDDSRHIWNFTDNRFKANCESMPG